MLDFALVAPTKPTHSPIAPANRAPLTSNHVAMTTVHAIVGFFLFFGGDSARYAIRRGPLVLLETELAELAT